MQSLTIISGDQSSHLAIHDSRRPDIVASLQHHMRNVEEVHESFQVHGSTDIYFGAYIHAPAGTMFCTQQSPKSKESSTYFPPKLSSAASAISPIVSNCHVNSTFPFVASTSVPSPPAASPLAIHALVNPISLAGT